MFATDLSSTNSLKLVNNNNITHISNNVDKKKEIWCIVSFSLVREEFAPLILLIVHRNTKVLQSSLLSVVALQENKESLKLI